MRIGFIERMAHQAMARKGLDRDQALLRQALVWGGLGTLCLLAWAVAPLDGWMLARRGTPVPVDFILAFCGGAFLLLGALCALSRGGEG